MVITYGINYGYISCGARIVSRQRKNYNNCITSENL